MNESRSLLYGVQPFNGEKNWQINLIGAFENKKNSEILTFDEFIDIAKNYSVKCHVKRNCEYDGKPYIIHLQMVYDYAVKYCHLIPSEYHKYVFSACWAHDVIEDTGETYNDVKKVCGEIVAELSYALTNEKGKNREERANDKYYEGIVSTPYATFIKLCDRLANAKYSKDTKGSMLKKYRKENQHFISKLYDEQYKPMFDELEELLK